MGEIRDIMATFRDFVGEISDTGAFKPQKSIAKIASNGICDFPVLVDETCPVDDAITISKALEKRYASLMLTAFTMNPYFTINGDTPDAQKYVQQFHQNMQKSNSSQDAVGAFDDYVNEAYEISGANYETCIQEGYAMAYSVFMNAKDRQIDFMNTSFNYTVEEVTNPTALNDIGRVRPTMEASGRKTGQGNKPKPNKPDNQPRNNNPRNNNPKLPSIQVNPTINPTISQSSSKTVKNYRDVTPMNPNVDAEYKKANDLTPTMLHIRVFPYDKASDKQLPAIDFIIGIKTTMHVIGVEDILLNMARGIRNQDGFFNFIRWTTGEIKFLKDFVLGVNDIKMDAINNSKGGSQSWFPALKRRKRLAQVVNLAGSKHNVLPNATLVVTTDVMETLKDQFGFDLTKSNTAIIRTLMERYFLLGFVRVNTALQRADFLFDNDKQYETLTFSALSRENSTDDRKFREMMKMIGRGM